LISDCSALRNESSVSIVFVNPAWRSLNDAMASRLGVRRDYVAVLVRLSYLSPEIVRANLVGQQPVELTPTPLVMLSRNLPHDWQEQRRLLGFAPA
jgi:hypothetical protein